MATAAIPLALKAGTAIVSALLAQHTLRLHDAADENQALDALIPAFDADIQEIVAAYNSGTPADQCIAALMAVDTNAYNYLRAQVGKPGTSWGGPSSASIGPQLNPTYSAACDKTCTAGCCVYLNDLRPAIFGRTVPSSSYAPFQTRAGIVGGLIEAISNGGGAVHVIPVIAPPNTAYGNYSRPTYDLTIVQPPLGSVASSILVSGSGVNFSVSTSTVAQGNGVAAIESALTGGSPVTILAVVGGLILIITALFGQNALRVK